MRLATWNVNSLAVRLPQVLDWLADAQGEAFFKNNKKKTPHLVAFLSKHEKGS